LDFTFFYNLFTTIHYLEFTFLLHKITPKTAGIMNRKTNIRTVILLALILGCTQAFSQTAEELLPKAIQLEEVKGELEQAIEIYQSIVDTYPDNRPVAAEAYYHMGSCYEKLGMEEARKSYQKVLDNYPEQTKAVKLANEKLTLLSRAETSIRKEDKVFNLRQVWADNELYGQGAPSPDGRYISYVHYDTGDLGILEIATGKKRRLTNKGTYAESDEFAEHSRWSADGKQIVYDWFNKEGFIELRIIGLDGSKPLILYKNEEVDWARTYGWSPDGKQILACFSRKDGAQQIVLVSAEDGSVGVLKILEKGWPKKMNFSPDGHYIVYDFPQNENSSERDIFLLSADGSREITLVEHPAEDFVLGWAPDGKNILFASDRTGTLSAWLISVADGLPQGAPELVKPDIGLFSTMGFTRDGSFYYHIGGGFIRDVYFAKLDPETGETLIPPKKAIKSFEGHNLSPDYSPDGKSLAYIRRIQDGDVLCIRSLETGEEREFHPKLKLKQIELPRWSPDGSSILVTGRDLNNIWGMHQIDALTGDGTTIVQNGGGGDWSPDGKDIFYARPNPDNSSQIMVREKESGAEKELYLVSDKGHLYLFCSPDRNWLVFIIWERGVLRVIPANGGEPRELYRLDKGERFGRSIAWTPDGKYIYFVKSLVGNSVRLEQIKCSLWRIPVEGGEPEKLDIGMNMIEHLSVHPDGQHIAFYTITSQVAAVWVMENFLPGSTAE
jgi:Tol biopolymer transport system component